jgi:hypothetical protein
MRSYKLGRKRVLAIVARILGQQLEDDRRTSGVAPNTQPDGTVFHQVRGITGWRILGILSNP